MLKEVLTADELKALIQEEETDNPEKGTIETFENGERKLLHALVRNQLRLLHMIEELQSEMHKLKSVAYDSVRGSRESAAGLEPLPLPFMKFSHANTRGQAGGSPNDGDGQGEKQEAPAADVSRKERFKRKSIW
jgi:hypothetical protein